MNENLFLEKTGLTVTFKCNLRCKLCAAYAPYLSDEPFPNNSELMEYVRKYFKIVDHVKLFSITGGEPLLYPDLSELFEELLEFSDRFDVTEIYTNGTIVPNEKLLNTLKKYGNKFRRFVVDRYDVSTKVDEIGSVLTKNDIPFEIREYNSKNTHCGGWIDYGSLTDVIHNAEESVSLFAKCAYSDPDKMGFCNVIKRGLLIPCGPVFRRISLGQNVSYDDYIDLMDETLTVEQQREKIVNINNAKVLETCAYCNGIHDGSPRFLPAQQLSNEEFQEIRNSCRGRLR